MRKRVMRSLRAVQHPPGRTNRRVSRHRLSRLDPTELHVHVALVTGAGRAHCLRSGRDQDRVSTTGQRSHSPMSLGRRFAEAAWIALGTCCVLVLACSKDHSATAPEPPAGEADQTVAVKEAWITSGFASPELYTTGTVTLSAPGPPGDMHAFAFRRIEHRRDSIWVCTLSEPDAQGRPLRAQGSLCFYIKQDFLLFVTDENGAQVAITKPDANEDLDREFIIRRDRADLPWHVDSLTASLMLSDDKTSCDLCHTRFVTLRVSGTGVDTSLGIELHEPRRAPIPQVPLGAPLRIQAISEQLGDVVFVRNGGEWSRLPAIGPRLFDGTVPARPGFNVLSVQAMT